MCVNTSAVHGMLWNTSSSKGHKMYFSWEEWPPRLRLECAECVWLTKDMTTTSTPDSVLLNSLWLTLPFKLAPQWLSEKKEKKQNKNHTTVPHRHINSLCIYIRIKELNWPWWWVAEGTAHSASQQKRPRSSGSRRARGSADPLRPLRSETAGPAWSCCSLGYGWS